MGSVHNRNSPISRKELNIIYFFVFTTFSKLEQNNIEHYDIFYAIGEILIGLLVSEKYHFKCTT